VAAIDSVNGGGSNSQGCRVEVNREKIRKKVAAIKVAPKNNCINKGCPQK